MFRIFFIVTLLAFDALSADSHNYARIPAVADEEQNVEFSPTSYPRGTVFQKINSLQKSFPVGKNDLPVFKSTKRGLIGRKAFFSELVSDGAVRYAIGENGFPIFVIDLRKSAESKSGLENVRRNFQKAFINKNLFWDTTAIIAPTYGGVIREERTGVLRLILLPNEIATAEINLVPIEKSVVNCKIPKNGPRPKQPPSLLIETQPQTAHASPQAESQVKYFVSPFAFPAPLQLRPAVQIAQHDFSNNTFSASRNYWVPTNYSTPSPSKIYDEQHSLFHLAEVASRQIVEVKDAELDAIDVYLADVVDDGVVDAVEVDIDDMPLLLPADTAYNQAIVLLARSEKNAAIKLLYAAYERSNLHAGFLSTILTNNCSPSSPVFQRSVTFYQIDFSKRDDAHLLVTLGEFYLADPTKSDLAFAFFSEGAEHDNASAIIHLATCYDKGIGTDVDKDKASELYVRWTLMH